MSELSVEADAGESSGFEEGRYLFCVVDLPPAVDRAFDTSGIDGADPYVIAADGIGVVVQDCESPFDSADMGTIKRWLVKHQAVIDEAGERFGTPLPFRFDTILKGDDEQVRGWVAEEADVLVGDLAEFSGRWEYRIELIRDRDALERQLAGEDDRLAEIDRQRDAASQGTAYLLAKQYEQRLRELTKHRVAEEAETLVDRLRDLAAVVEEVDGTSVDLHEAEAGQPTDHRRTLSVLAAEEREDAIGELLEEYAARAGTEIRFTGPWPPYSFAPELGRDS